MCQNLSLYICISEYFPTLPHFLLEMHPGKKAGALHAKDRDEDVGDEDEENDDGCGVVQAVQALLVGFVVEVSPSCNKHTCIHIHTQTHTHGK